MVRIAASYKMFFLAPSHICSGWFLSLINIFCSISKAMAFIWRFCDAMGFKLVQVSSKLLSFYDSKNATCELLKMLLLFLVP